VLLVFAATLGLAGYLGWEKLAPRLKNIFTDDLSGRVQLYRNAQQIARDFPVYGTGPGTFPWVYQLYRADQNQEWAAYAHNDWLETRITFGWVGFAMILVMLLLVPSRWLAGGNGIQGSWLLVAMIGLSLAGCLVHARFDFPLQIYSTLALFLHWCAVLFCLSRKT
jgi:O-antigen ligase